jgi:hypothetical protein
LAAKKTRFGGSFALAMALLGVARCAGGSSQLLGVVLAAIRFYFALIRGRASCRLAQSQDLGQQVEDGADTPRSVQLAEAV